MTSTVFTIIQHLMSIHICHPTCHSNTLQISLPGLYKFYYTCDFNLSFYSTCKSSVKFWEETDYEVCYRDIVLLLSFWLGKSCAARVRSFDIDIPSWSAINKCISPGSIEIQNKSITLQHFLKILVMYVCENCTWVPLTYLSIGKTVQNSNQESLVKEIQWLAQLLILNLDVFAKLT